MNENTFSPADLAAVMRNNNDGNMSSWWIILLFICLFSGGYGGFGAGSYPANIATSQDIQRSIDLSAIQRGQADIAADVQRTAYEVGNVAKDAAYNNLSEIRDVQASLATDTAALQSSVNNGFTNMATGFCSTQRAIDGAKYEAAINTAAINANIDEKFAAIEKGQLQAQIAAQQNQINSLQLNAAVCGVPRISPYAYGVTPSFGYTPYVGGTTF